VVPDSLCQHVQGSVDIRNVVCYPCSVRVRDNSVRSGLVEEDEGDVPIDSSNSVQNRESVFPVDGERGNDTVNPFGPYLLDCFGYVTRR